MPRDLRYTSYKYRWVVLTGFGLLSFVNAALWISFSPIQVQATQYFGISESKIWVNLLSLVFMFLYLPATILSSYCLDRYGLQKSIIVACILTGLNGWVRYFGSFIDSGEVGRYLLVLFGQCLGAMGQPFLTNAPAKVAASWFPAHQRELATIIAALLNPLGNAAGSVFPGIIVPSTTDPAVVEHDVTLMMLIFAIASSIVCVFTALTIREKPPTPPSHAASQRDIMRAESLSKVQSRSLKSPLLADAASPRSDIDTQVSTATTSIATIPSEGHADPAPEVTPEISSIRRVYLEGKELMKMKDFVFLMLGFGIGLGMFNAMLTLLSQLVHPCGYGSGEAGMFGGILVGSGLIGAGCIGPVLERTKGYAKVLKIMAVFLMGGMVFFLASLMPDQTPLVAISIGVLGFFTLPLLPVSLENVAELTYPTPEETGSAILLLAGQFFGIAFIFAIPALLPQGQHCTTIFKPSSILLTSAMLLAFVFILLYQPKYNRLAAERSSHPAEESIQATENVEADALISDVA